jgi:hypothetical protein
MQPLKKPGVSCGEKGEKREKREKSKKSVSARKVHVIDGK